MEFSVNGIAPVGDWLPPARSWQGVERACGTDGHCFTAPWAGTSGVIDEDDLTHLDRVLLPILQRLAREQPPEAGPVLLALWEVVMQLARLRPEVRKLLWHLVERWHELVRSQGNPKVPASTNRLEGWSGALWARFKPRARLTRD